MLPTARIVFASSTLCLAAHTAVIYNFSGTENFFGTSEVFQYTAPTLIAADTFIPASALDSCSTGQSLPCFGVNFLPSGPDTPQHYPELTFQIANPDNSVGTVFYYFPLGSSFDAFGVLTTVPFLGNVGVLTIADAPEPPALNLLVGLLIVMALFQCPSASQRVLGARDSTAGAQSRS